MLHRIAAEKTCPAPATPLTLGFRPAVLVTFFNAVSAILMLPSWLLNPIVPRHGIESYSSTFDVLQKEVTLP